MNTSGSLEWPKQTFVEQGKNLLKKANPWLYTHIFSYSYILEKLQRKSRKDILTSEQEKKLNHFISFIKWPENADILESICTMKTSKEYDMQWLLATLEQAEKQEKIGPNFVMDTILLFFHAPRQEKLSPEEKTACTKLSNMLTKRIPSIRKYLPKIPRI